MSPEREQIAPVDTGFTNCGRMMNTEIRLLRGLLGLIGCGLTSAVGAVFLPTEWMAASHEFLGLGPFPTATLTEYLTRSIALLYTIHGVLLLAIAIHLRSAWPVIPWVGTTDLLFGLGIFGIDLAAGMPTYWVVMEGPGIALGGLAVLGLWWRQRNWCRQV